MAEVPSVPEAARRLGELFAAGGHQLFLVGGAVRDHMLGGVSSGDDIDLTTDARPTEILAIVEPIATSVWRQGERFGTIGATVFGRAVEITTYRSEHYDENSRRPVVGFGDDLETDLSRRDFSINAMARSVLTGELVDPYDGRLDLERRWIRTPLSPHISFTDDPLRILRAARFASRLNFTLDPALVEAARELRERLGIVSGERILAELDRLLSLPDPTVGIRFLWETGVLSEALDRAPLPSYRSVADALGRMVGDSGSVDTTSDLGVRWAALCHLCGLDVEDLADLLRMSNMREREIATLVSTKLPDPDDLLQVRRAILNPGPDAVERVLEVARVTGSHPRSERVAISAVIAERAAAEPPETLRPPLDGDQVIEALGIEPGPQVGKAMNFLVESAIAEGPLSPERARILLSQFQARQSP